MMDTILKKYTTIPQDLYVSRDADIQLKKIIEEMQRPGYVLVARQMGKTNLLFNAKRTLENENRLFAYIDLSNLYLNERDCYRNIINNIIEPNLNIFKSIELEINDLRDKNLPPHNEYSRSLVSILNSLKGDLVIILDEIDALKSVTYSDNIFAQIRSNYFSRTNYPVLERLTYVLSGVIEPTELIKDRNKSPFNIGEKIYLDDFTKDEHNIFIEQSKLKVSENISSEIYNWTNGNPRLTFDICAEIENYVNSNGEIDGEKINKIITSKYLTSYDIAPIDHIRELVKSNKDIRKAINHIHNKKSLEINDETKRKLYLYGIINSKFNEETFIKNKIIELTLSQEWIKSIDKESSFVYALAKYSDKQYQAAIEILLEVVVETKSSSEIDGCNYFLGMSYLKLTDFQNAIIYFSKDYKDKKYKTDSKAFLGVCLMGNGEGESGISLLEEAVKEETNTNAYHNALLNLAVNINDDNKALLLFEKLYNSTLVSEDSNEHELNELKSLSLYYQAEIFGKKKEYENAILKLDLALTFSNISDSIAIVIKKYNFQLEKDEDLKRDVVDRIINNNLTFNNSSSYPITFSEKKIYNCLDFVFSKDDLNLFEKLINYVDERLILEPHISDIIYYTSLNSLNNRFQILEYLLKKYQDINTVLLYQIYRDQLSGSTKNEKSFIEIFDKYYDLFLSQSDLIVNDIYLFAIAIKINSDRNNIQEAIRLAKVIENRVNVCDSENIKNEAVIIFYWLSHLYFGLRERNNAIYYADRTLELIEKTNGKKMSMVDEKGLKVMSDQVKQVKTSSNVIIPIINPRKYGRNDWIRVRYNDGKETEKKYKVLEADILAERCVII